MKSFIFFRNILFFSFVSSFCHLMYLQKKSTPGIIRNSIKPEEIPADSKTVREIIRNTLYRKCFSRNSLFSEKFAA